MKFNFYRCLLVIGPLLIQTATFSQEEIDCDSAVVAPTVLDGITVTEEYTGSVSIYDPVWTSCTYTMPPHSLHLGATGSFSYTYLFSEDINDLVIIITGTGTGTDEEFTLTTSAGIPDIIDESSCFTTIVGNTIYSGAGSGPDGGGGIFTIHNPSGAYNTLTVEGPGGVAGSLFALCASSVISMSGVEITHVTCNGECDGAAIVVEGDLPPYTYEWDPATGGGTGGSVEGLCPGTYWVEVTDGEGNIDTLDVVITEPDVITEETAVTNITCFGNTDGEINVVATGGTGALTYDIGDGPVDSGEFTGLSAGSYTITVTDENDCFIEVTVEVTEPDEMVVTETIFHGSCNLDCTGEITLEVTGGVEPYNFSIDNCTTTSDEGEFPGLCEGDYDVCVEDDNGCQYTSDVTLLGAETLELNIITYNHPSCYGFSDGSITVEAEGGGDDYVTFEWTPENPVPGSTFNNLGAGVYKVVAYNDAGCIDSLEVEIIEPDSLWAEATTIDVACHGDATGIAEVVAVHNAQGDLGNISYHWEPNFFGDNGIGVDSAYNMTAGEYVVTINDDNGCSYVIDFVINEPPAMEFVELGFYPAYCRMFSYQSGNGVVFAAAAGGTPDYTYEWLNLGTTDTEDGTTWGGLNPGDYQITATDENGCELVEIVRLDSVNPKAAFTVNSDQLDENCEGTELAIVNFTNQSEYFSNPYDSGADTTFLWNLNTPNGAWQVSHDYFDTMDTTYTGEAIYEVCLVALNKNGCADTTCKNLIVHVQPEFEAPNVFSPGGSEPNNVFTFEYRSLGIAEFHCVIVNRWGVKVAELNDITDSWDGTDFGGDECSNGVYFYTYEAISTNNTVFSGQGNVHIVREE